MAMSRRGFLGWTVGAIVMRPPLTRIVRFARCVILDLGTACSLPESIAGYEAALGAGVVRTDVWSVLRSATLIVPAAVEIPPAAVRAIASCVQAGGRVILESGAGFASQRDFRAHRAALRDALDIEVDTPVSLWLDSSARGAPYVDFTWPISTKIRDFSRVVPLASQTGEIIARVAGLSAALRRRSGPGELLFLGSPLGPALWAGDAEARRWLQAVAGTREALSN
jgi:hypothetical protein